MATQWFGAVSAGDLPYIKRNMKSMAKKRDRHEHTALMCAVASENFPVAKLLVEVEAEECDPKGYNALTMVLLKPGRLETMFELKPRDQTSRQTPDVISADMLSILSPRLAAYLDAAGALPIAYAIENRHIECISPLLAHTTTLLASVCDQPDVILPGYTSLMVGCLMHDISMCEKYRQQVRHKNKSGQTALMISAMTGFRQGVEFLLQAEMRMQDQYGFTALIYASMRGDTDLVRKLGPQEGDLRSSTGCTAAMIGAYYGHAAVVSTLRNIGQYRRLTDHQGRSLLMYAMFGMPIHQLTSVIQECGGIQDNNGKSALMYAAERNYVELCRLLLPVEANLVDVDGNSALHYALRTRSFEAARDIVRHKVMYISVDDWSPLMLYALGAADSDTVFDTNLVDSNLGKKTADGTTALILAAMFGNIGLAQLLIGEAGIQEKQEVGGMSALMYAIQRGHLDVAKALVDVSHSLTDAHGRTAMMYAVRSGMPQIVKLLLPYELHKKDRNGVTALIYAAEIGDADTVALLVGEAGETDNEGRTALMHALAYNHQQCYRYLFPLEGNIYDGEGQSPLVYFQSRHLIYSKRTNRVQVAVTTTPAMESPSTPPVFVSKPNIQSGTGWANIYKKLNNKIHKSVAPLSLVSSMDTIATAIQAQPQQNALTWPFMRSSWLGMRAIQLVQMCEQLKDALAHMAADTSNHSMKPMSEISSSDNLFSKSLCHFSMDSSATSGASRRKAQQAGEAEHTPNVVLYPCKHFIYMPTTVEGLSPLAVCPKCQRRIQSYEYATI